MADLTTVQRLAADLGTRQVVIPEAAVELFSADLLMASMDRIRRAPWVLPVKCRGPRDV